MSRIRDVDDVERLLHNQLLARERHAIATHMLSEAMTAWGVRFNRVATHDIMPSGFGLLPHCAMSERATNAQGSSGACNVVTREELKEHCVHNVDTTLMIKKIPLHWDFKDIIETLSNYGIEQFSHYDCICIPTVQGSESRCAFINATCLEAKKSIFFILNGLLEAADGSILVPPLELTCAECQGLAFYMESYPTDSMFFCGENPVDPGTRCCPKTLDSYSSANDTNRMLLSRLLHKDVEEKDVFENDGLSSSAPGTHDVCENICELTVDPELLLQRLLDDASGAVRHEQGDPAANISSKTTVCIKGLCKHIAAIDFANTLSSELNITQGKDIDFLYIPMDFARGENKGYAILNLRNPSMARHLVEFRVGLSGSSGLLAQHIMWASVQGFEANAKVFLARHRRIRNPRCKPLVWQHESSSTPEILSMSHIRMSW